MLLKTKMQNILTFALGGKTYLDGQEETAHKCAPLLIGCGQILENECKRVKEWLLINSGFSAC